MKLKILSILALLGVTVTAIYSIVATGFSLATVMAVFCVFVAVFVALFISDLQAENNPH